MPWYTSEMSSPSRTQHLIKLSQIESQHRVTRTEDIRMEKNLIDYRTDRILNHKRQNTIINPFDFTHHSLADRRAQVVHGTTAARTWVEPTSAARAPVAVVEAVPEKKATAVFADGSWAAGVDGEGRGGGSGGVDGVAHFVVRVWVCCWCFGSGLVTVFDELKIQDGSVDFIDSGRLCSVGVGVKVGWSNTMGLSCIQRTKQHDEWKTTKVCPTNESNTGFTVTTLWTKKGNPKDTKTNSSFAPYQFEAALTFPGTASESCSELRNGQSRLVKNLN
jgi:hypothetical protein